MDGKIKKPFTPEEVAERKGSYERQSITDSADQRTEFIGRKLNGEAKRTSWARLNLTDSDFCNTDLCGSSFKGANLSVALFWDADLSDCDFTDAKHLLSEQFAGAVLNRAKVSAEGGEWRDLERVHKLSESGSKVSLSLLGAFAFVILTAFSTKDYSLILGNQGAKLPLIGVEVPIEVFLIAAPVLLLILYFYLHIYLQHLWEALNRLPAIFPDGRRIEEATYPWLLNDLGGRYLPRLARNHRPLAWLQHCFALLLGWWLIPFGTAGLWAYGLRAQDGVITYIQLLCCALTVAGAVWFSTLRSATFDARRKGYANMTASAQWLALGKAAIAFLLMVVLLACWSDGVFTTEQMPASFTHKINKIDGVSNGNIEQVTVFPDSFEPHADPHGTCWQRWGPHILMGLSMRPYAIVPGVDFSKKPSSWTDDEQKASIEIPLVQEGRFVGKRLRNIWAWQAFLVKADLTDSNLEGALFPQSDLRSAVFRKTAAARCIFQYSRFSDSTTSPDSHGLLTYHAVGMSDSDFAAANFTGSSMRGLHANNCSFVAAEFAEVDALESHWKACDLCSANFRWASLLKAKFLAYCNLEHVNFDGADLSDALFENANCEGVNFENACLAGADLQSTNVSMAQLVKAGTLKGAKLKAEMEKQLQDRLLNDPSREEWKKGG